MLYKSSRWLATPSMILRLIFSNRLCLPMTCGLDNLVWTYIVYSPITSPILHQSVRGKSYLWRKLYFSPAHTKEMWSDQKEDACLSSPLGLSAFGSHPRRWFWAPQSLLHRTWQSTILSYAPTNIHCVQRNWAQVHQPDYFRYYKYPERLIELRGARNGRFS